MSIFLGTQLLSGVSGTAGTVPVFEDGGDGVGDSPITVREVGGAGSTVFRVEGLDLTDLTTPTTGTLTVGVVNPTLGTTSLGLLQVGDAISNIGNPVTTLEVTDISGLPTSVAVMRTGVSSPGGLNVSGLVTRSGGTTTDGFRLDYTGNIDPFFPTLPVVGVDTTFNLTTAGETFLPNFVVGAMVRVLASNIVVEGLITTVSATSMTVTISSVSGLLNRGVPTGFFVVLEPTATTSETTVTDNFAVTGTIDTPIISAASLATDANGVIIAGTGAGGASIVDANTVPVSNAAGDDYINSPVVVSTSAGGPGAEFNWDGSIGGFTFDARQFANFTIASNVLTIGTDSSGVHPTDPPGFEAGGTIVFTSDFTSPNIPPGLVTALATNTFTITADHVGGSNDSLSFAITFADLATETLGSSVTGSFSYFAPPADITLTTVSDNFEVTGTIDTPIISAASLATNADGVIIAGTASGGVSGTAGTIPVFEDGGDGVGNSPIAISEVAGTPPAPLTVSAGWSFLNSNTTINSPGTDFTRFADGTSVTLTQGPTVETLIVASTDSQSITFTTALTGIFAPFVDVTLTGTGALVDVVTVAGGLTVTGTTTLSGVADGVALNTNVIIDPATGVLSAAAAAAGGGGTTINPTDGTIPLRMDGDTFVDSFITQVNTAVPEMPGALIGTNTSTLSGVTGGAGNLLSGTAGWLLQNFTGYASGFDYSSTAAGFGASVGGFSVSFADTIAAAAFLGLANLPPALNFTPFAATITVTQNNGATASIATTLIVHQNATGNVNEIIHFVGNTTFNAQPAVTPISGSGTQANVSSTITINGATIPGVAGDEIVTVTGDLTVTGDTDLSLQNENGSASVSQFRIWAGTQAQFDAQFDNDGSGAVSGTPAEVDGSVIYIIT